MSQLLLKDVKAALWFKEAVEKNNYTGWDNQLKNKPLYLSLISTIGTWTADQRQIVSDVIDAILMLVPDRNDPQPVSPFNGPIQAFGVDNAIGWMREKLGEVYISHFFQGGPPHSTGNAVDFSGPDTFSLMQLGRVFVRMFRTFPGTSGAIGIGIESADRHLHVDKGYRSGHNAWIETNKQVNSPAWYYYPQSPAARWVEGLAKVTQTYITNVNTNVQNYSPEKKNSSVAGTLAGALIGSAVGYEDKTKTKMLVYALGGAAAGFLIDRVRDAIDDSRSNGFFHNLMELMRK